MLEGEHRDRLNLAQSGVRITLLEHAIELPVAVRGVQAAVPKWTVDAKHAARSEHAADALEEILDLGPRDDVQGVGRKNGVGAAQGPHALADVKLRGNAQVLRAFALDTRRQIREVRQLLGGIPREMGERARKMHGMLTGAAADFQHLRTSREMRAQHLENGFFVAFAGCGEGKHDALILL